MTPAKRPRSLFGNSVATAARVSTSIDGSLEHDTAAEAAAPASSAPSGQGRLPMIAEEELGAAELQRMSPSPRSQHDGEALATPARDLRYLFGRLRFTFPYVGRKLLMEDIRKKKDDPTNCLPGLVLDSKMIQVSLRLKRASHTGLSLPAQPPRTRISLPQTWRELCLPPSGQ
jgi:hypothetical protein